MKIEFTNEQLSILNQAIIELPYRLAAPLIVHINAEIQKRREEEKVKPTDSAKND